MNKKDLYRPLRSALTRIRTEPIPFFLNTLAGGAFLAAFIVAGTATPGTSAIAATAATAVPRYNSQTLPVLKPAFNINPGAARGGGDIAIVGGSALLAQSGPSGTIADIEERPSASQISVYTVHNGDTLSGIAAMFDVSVNTIIWANDLTGSTVHPGQELIILPVTGIRHAILKGETLASLAKKYKSDAEDIAQYNGLPDDALLAVGDTVIIPNGEVAAAHATAKSSSRSVVAGTEPYRGGSGAAIPGYFAWPTAGGVVTQKLHGWNAVDIGAPSGTAVYAAAAGTVIIARQNGGWNGGYGNYIVVAHGNGTQTLYAHLSAVTVSSGTSVEQGVVIGKVGSTGQSTGPHLHFEVRGAQNPFVR